MDRCAKPVESIRRNQHQFHRRMRRKCINLCAEQQKKGDPLDPVLSPVERNGITMAALRKLESIAKQNKAPSGTNRAFGALQEVHASSSGVSFQLSQGLSGVNPLPSAQLPFSICAEERDHAVATDVPPPWGTFHSQAAQSKENQRKGSMCGLTGRSGNGLECRALAAEARLREEAALALPRLCRPCQPSSLCPCHGGCDRCDKWTGTTAGEEGGEVGMESGRET